MTIESIALTPGRTKKRRCRVCGCTDGKPCIRVTPKTAKRVEETCCWAAPDLCSGCEEKMGVWLTPAEQLIAFQYQGHRRGLFRAPRPKPKKGR